MRAFSCLKVFILEAHVRLFQIFDLLGNSRVDASSEHLHPVEMIAWAPEPLLCCRLQPAPNPLASISDYG